MSTMTTKNVNVRIPKDLHGKAKKCASDERHSLNSMILLFIEEGIASRKAKAQ